ncbi:MAG: FtsX-like permease family protein [FCB group bacterium]|nr:FtsX-like permease family protein [FCB group bacterium]
MMRFLLKGLIRDRSRSLFPLLIVTMGVSITVLVVCWVNGAGGDVIRTNARFFTGHVKIMTRAYAEQADQMPNDLALLKVNELIAGLKKRYPQVRWVPRIRFGGLLDIPDEQGETRTQGPVMGLAVDLINAESREVKMLNLEKALVRGRLPRAPMEILISDEFAKKLGVPLNEPATLIGSTMYGGLAMQNFIVVGTVRFGIAPMDRGAMIADISGVQSALAMDDAAGEVLGFFRNDLYDPATAHRIQSEFNRRFEGNDDEFTPVMLTLEDQNDLGTALRIFESASSIMIFIFVMVMSIVLWNTGLMGSLRRYGEMGVRLAIGESKGHIYGTLILEALVIGFVGSVAGTMLGLSAAYYLQVHGVDISGMVKNSSVLMSNVMRAKISPSSYYIGFIPGFLATVLGSMISGIGIFKRQTAQLFKELEV